MWFHVRSKRRGDLFRLLETAHIYTTHIYTSSQFSNGQRKREIPNFFSHSARISQTAVPDPPPFPCYSHSPARIYVYIYIYNTQMVFSLSLYLLTRACAPQYVYPRTFTPVRPFPKLLLSSFGRRHESRIPNWTDSGKRSNERARHSGGGWRGGKGRREKGWLYRTRYQP